jgi:branched-chain amino acid transport system substrate-binding protein
MLRLNKAALLLAAAVALLALVAVACGGGDEEEGTATATPKPTGTAAATTTPKPTGTAAATTTPKPTGTAAATATPQPPETATAAATATPPPAETPAATATPPPAAGPVQGVTDTEIILGSHFAQSGTYGASFSPVLNGFKAYINYVNEEKGGVCNRKINFTAIDDQYDPALAVEAVRKLVEQEKIFALVIGLGTAAHSAVWDYLNEKGIPDLWAMTGAHKWGADPATHPWTVGILPDYFVEGTIFGKYISENFPGKKVTIIHQNDDYGKDELAGLKNGLDPSKNELVSEQSYETTAVDIRSQITNMKQTGAEVAVCACIPGYAAQAIKAANNLGWKPQWFIGYVNSDPVMFSYASPEDMEGTLTLQALKLATFDDPAVVEHKRILSKYGNGPPGNFSIVGQVAGELMEKVLSDTCDNLTPDGLMSAVESIRDYQSELTLPGVTISVSDDDHVGFENMRFLRAKIVDGKGVWEYEGELMSFR